MYDPISVETALVSSGGDLLIQLSDGNVINAGRVRGNPGPQGEKGEQGIRGAHGKDGIDGTNGAMWHTGVGAPEISLGVNGDLYMDVASALLPIFQKVNGDWLFLCNLKVPPSGGGGGQAGAAGGGGSIIIYPQPDGGPQPDKDNDGKPIDKGDIWFDPNTGLLWVYNGSEWLPVGDRPPVSVGPNPPIWNSSGDTNNRYPVREGDLWFDSDQLALYVAAEDTSNNLVWVITIPADRSVLLDEVNPFVFPASSTGTYANDGDTAFNDTTQLWYIYNGSKNQWIDLPPGKTELSLTAILLRGADNFPTTFEYEPADRVTYDTEALCYVNADDHPNFTRIVVPFVDTAGFDWRTLLRGITVGDQLSLIQIDRGDPDDPNDEFPFRSDYITVAEIVENSESFNLGLDFQQENPDHLPLFGEEVAIRFKAIVNTGDREIIYQENAPDLNTHPNLLEGNLWVDSDDNKMYVWNGSVWSEVTACTGANDEGQYVKKKGGDSMEGPLIVTGGRNVNTATGLEGTVKTLNVDSGQNSSLNLKFDGNTRVYVGDQQMTIAADLKFNGSDRAIYTGPDKKGFVVDNDGVFYDGDYTDDRHVATKANVDELSNQIIELEEEIDAIAPAVERGSWEFTLSGTISGPGKLTAYDEYVATSGNATGLVTNIQSLWFHSIDNAGTPHGFDNVEAGNLLELFVEGSPEYGLFTVVEVHDFTTGGGNYWVIDVDFVRTLEQTTRFDNGEVCRLKIFEAPSGGTAGDFIKSSGFTDMPGNVIVRPAAGKGSNFAVFGGDGTGPNQTIFYVRDADGNTVFRAKNDGKVQAGQGSSSALMATEDNDLTTKKFVDDKFDFSQYPELS